MCIICNTPFNSQEAEDFLMNHCGASLSMKAATKAMLEVSHVALSEDDRKRYSRIHKKMVRMTKDWNRLEEDRERLAGSEKTK